MTQLRKLLYRQLDPAVWDGEGLSTVNRAVLTVVFLSILAVVVESEPSISQLYGEEQKATGTISPLNWFPDKSSACKMKLFINI